MIRMHAAPSPASSPAEKWPNHEKAETRAPGLITKKPRIVVRGSPAFLTDRARGKWAAGCLPNAAGVSWFLSSKGCGVSSTDVRRVDMNASTTSPANKKVHPFLKIGER